MNVGSGYGYRYPTYEAKYSGITWSVYESGKAILHNLTEWQAKAIIAILKGS